MLEANGFKSSLRCHKMLFGMLFNDEYKQTPNTTITHLRLLVVDKWMEMAFSQFSM